MMRTFKNTLIWEKCACWAGRQNPSLKSSRLQITLVLLAKWPTHTEIWLLSAPNLNELNDNKIKQDDVFQARPNSASNQRTTGTTLLGTPACHNTLIFSAYVFYVYISSALMYHNQADPPWTSSCTTIYVADFVAASQTWYGSWGWLQITIQMNLMYSSLFYLTL